MQYLEAVILGLVQGLTEFLPVSSSGHLAIFKRILGADALSKALTMDILLHVGTLIAVFAVYRRDIGALLREGILMIWDLLRGKPDFKTPYRRFVLLVLIGIIPAGISGVLLKDAISTLPLLAVGLALFVTAIFLWLSDKIVAGKRTMADASYRSALLVGVFQAVAILPGISRSGATITGGTVAGFSREFAVKFSFILSIPAILGAALLDAVDILKSGTIAIEAGPALVGMATAAISGYLAMRWLLKLVQNSKFHYFSYYCAAAGVLAVLLHIGG